MASNRGITNLTVRAGALLGCAAIFVCAAFSQPRRREVHVILIDKFTYQPDVLAVHVGETVEWRNTDIVPHTATSVDKGTFDSGRIQTGDSWRLTLRKTGTFDYLCTFHPNMRARLVVR